MTSKEYVEIDAFYKIKTFLDEACPSPDDRMFRASDNTWWKREGMEWVRSTAPDDVQDKQRKSMIRIKDLVMGMSIDQIVDAIQQYHNRKQELAWPKMKENLNRSKWGGPWR